MRREPFPRCSSRVRTAILQLLPLSTRESSKVTLLRGGYPGLLARPASSELWFRSYLQTYLERDIGAVTAVRDLSAYRRFLALLASRCGTLLNKTDCRSCSRSCERVGRF